MRCPYRGCGAWVDGGPPASRPRAASGSGLTPGQQLLALSFVPALASVFFLYGAIERDLDATTSTGALVLLGIVASAFISNTLFFIGCIAEGVRIGTKLH